MKIRRHHLLQTCRRRYHPRLRRPRSGSGHRRPEGNSHARAGSAIELLQRQETARGAGVCGGLESCLREFQATVAPT